MSMNEIGQTQAQFVDSKKALKENRVLAFQNALLPLSVYGLLFAPFLMERKHPVSKKTKMRTSAIIIGLMCLAGAVAGGISDYYSQLEAQKTEKTLENPNTGKWLCSLAGAVFGTAGAAGYLSVGDKKRCR